MRLRSVALPILLPLALGCGSAGDDGRPPRHPVEGTITYNGKPVDYALVTFSPEAAEGGMGAFGNTDENGHYTLTTADPADGAIVGNYKVTVTKGDLPTETASNAPYDEKTYVPPGIVSSARQAPKPKPLLPLKYATPDATDLTAEVKEGSNTFDFTLKD